MPRRARYRPDRRLSTVPSLPQWRRFRWSVSEVFNAFGDALQVVLEPRLRPNTAMHCIDTAESACTLCSRACSKARRHTVPTCADRCAASAHSPHAVATGFRSR